MVLLLFITIILIILGPQWWIKWIIHRNQHDLERIPGTGAELATHLLEKFNIDDVSVERTQQGDHYDPSIKVVALSDAIYDGRSLASVAIAAHEVGHAIQHKQGMKMFQWRGRLVQLAIGSEKLGVMALMAVPLVGGLLRIPHPMIALLLIGIGSLLIGVIVHLVTLPVEWDASFNKALPVLIKGEYISVEDTQVVKRLLTAAALTYVAATLASILNMWRWIAILKR